jgi:hypothetical protein
MAMLSQQTALAQGGMTEAATSPALSVSENGQQVEFDFNVVNNTAFTMYLDWAAVTIVAGPPDTSDTAFWPTFVVWAPSIAAGVTQPFDVVFSVTPYDGPGENDYGVSGITFGSEWNGSVGTLGPGGNGGAGVIADPNTLNTLLNLFANPAGPFPAPGNPLDAGGQVLPPVVNTLVVNDPDASSTFILLGLGTLSLLAYDWRRRMARFLKSIRT